VMGKDASRPLDPIVYPSDDAKRERYATFEAKGCGYWKDGANAKKAMCSFPICFCYPTWRSAKMITIPDQDN
jgi:hypothetical protein